MSATFENALLNRISFICLKAEPIKPYDNEARLQCAIGCDHTQVVSLLTTKTKPNKQGQKRPRPGSPGSGIPWPSSTSSMSMVCYLEDYSNPNRPEYHQSTLLINNCGHTNCTNLVHYLSTNIKARGYPDSISLGIDISCDEACETNLIEIKYPRDNYMWPYVMGYCSNHTSKGYSGNTPFIAPFLDLTSSGAGHVITQTGEGGMLADIMRLLVSKHMYRPPSAPTTSYWKNGINLYFTAFFRISQLASGHTIRDFEKRMADILEYYLSTGFYNILTSGNRRNGSKEIKNCGIDIWEATKGVHLANKIEYLHPPSSSTSHTITAFNPGSHAPAFTIAAKGQHLFAILLKIT